MAERLLRTRLGRHGPLETLYVSGENVAARASGDNEGGQT
jgi:hypothetical protein